MSGHNSVMMCFFFRNNFNKSLCKNMFLVSLYSRPSPLVRAPPQLKFPPSPTTLRLFLFLSTGPLTVAPFTQNMIYNTFNARSASLIILAEEGVPIFDSCIRFSPMAVSFGVKKLKRIIISSLSVTSPYKTKWIKTQ